MGGPWRCRGGRVRGHVVRRAVPTLAPQQHQVGGPRAPPPSLPPSLPRASLPPCCAGVRNTVGFDIHPDTGKLYFTDNGRDSECRHRRCRSCRAAAGPAASGPLLLLLSSAAATPLLLLLAAAAADGARRCCSCCHLSARRPSFPATASDWDLLSADQTDNRPDCELNVATEEGQFFG